MQYIFSDYLLETNLTIINNFHSHLEAQGWIKDPENQVRVAIMLAL